MTTTLAPKFLSPEDGLRLQSGPGRDLVFKVTGEDTRGAFDYFVVEVAPHGGPPLHVHHSQEETIHVLSGRFKVRVGDEEAVLEKGGFAFMPAGLPHAFLNLTDEDAEIVIVYTPGGGHLRGARPADAEQHAGPRRGRRVFRAPRHDPPGAAAQFG
jgi:quercetin dioxygenase-like cupin family protein